MKGKNILIVYTDIGKGHVKAALAVKEVFEKERIDVKIADFLTFLPKPYHVFMKDAYLQLIKYIPQAYSLAYKFTSRMEPGEAKIYANIVSVSVYPFIERMYESFVPDIVISTHPITTLSFGFLKERRVKTLKVVGIVTDYHIMNFFLAKEMDFVVAPHEKVIEDFLEKNGQSSVPLYPTGIPISLKFASSISKEESKASLKLDRNEKAVLVMTGGLGFPHLVEVAESISDKKFAEPITIICLVGKNDNIVQELKRLEKEKHRRNKILYVRWTGEVWKYMKASDMIISKAGGVTIAEASVSSLPFVVYKPLPGQEYLNANFLLKNNASLSVNSKELLPDAVQKVLFGGANSVLSDNISKIGKPFASVDLVNNIKNMF
jgi:processive 1,2-diacylglycerol beta-glucosyltransferase